MPNEIKVEITITDDYATIACNGIPVVVIYDVDESDVEMCGEDVTFHNSDGFRSPRVMITPTNGE